MSESNNNNANADGVANTVQNLPVGNGTVAGKPGAAKSSESEKPASSKPHLVIKIRDQDNNELNFKVKPTTKFAKIFESFCKQLQKSRGDVRFLLDDQRIAEDKCPQDYEMEDGDVIDCYVAQIGGRASGSQCRGW